MSTSPTTTVKAGKKKSTKLNPTIIKQRREAIEKRIIKLEDKLKKDRTLLLRYTEEEEQESSTD